MNFHSRKSSSLEAAPLLLSKNERGKRSWLPGTSFRKAKLLLACACIGVLLVCDVSKDSRRRLPNIADDTELTSSTPPSTPPTTPSTDYTPSPRISELLQLIESTKEFEEAKPYFQKEAKKLDARFQMNLQDDDMQEIVDSITTDYSVALRTNKTEFSVEEYWVKENADVAFMCKLPMKYTKANKKDLIRRIQKTKLERELNLEHKTEIREQTEIFLEYVEETLDVKCPVCFDDCVEGDDGVTLDCNHDFCKTCIENLFKSAVAVPGIETTVECPGDYCHHTISLNEAQRKNILDPEVMAVFRAKVQKQGSIEEIAEKQNMTWNCLVCNFQNFNEHREKEVTCANGECSQTFCFPCRAQHEGSCQAYQQREFGDNIKSCPKCYRSVFKNEGCIHMICNHPIYDPEDEDKTVIGECSYSWCWICNGHFSKEGHMGQHGYGICGNFKKSLK